MYHLHPFAKQCDTVWMLLGILSAGGSLWIGWLGNDDSIKNPYAYRLAHNQTHSEDEADHRTLWHQCLGGGSGKYNFHIVYEIVNETDFFGTTEYQGREKNTFSILVVKSNSRTHSDR